MPPDRRQFLRSTAGAAGAALIPASLGGLVSLSAACGGDGERFRPEVAGIGEGGYGPLVRETGVLTLPEDFRAVPFGAVGDPMSDGQRTPIAPDGMAAFAVGTGTRLRLLRNHEDRNGPTAPIGGESGAYDRVGGGGVVTLEVDADRRLLRDFVSLNGTTVNCAGGPTPWGSWLSCEETAAGRPEGYERPHGFVFEVDARSDGPVEPIPLEALGRFSHEAIAVDPGTGILYLTEDNEYAEGDPTAPGSGLYRFLPERPNGGLGSLRAGGELQAARVVGHPRMELFRGAELGLEVGDGLELEWVPIREPVPSDEAFPEEGVRRMQVFSQGLEGGAAVFARLEGCWYGEEGVYFHDTVGGEAGLGQVWRYLPGTGELVLVFESPGREVLNGPDNVTVSPRGGVVICEDAHGLRAFFGHHHLRGLTPDGRIFDLARNDLNRSELAGATFGPDGRTLFVNVQGPTSGSIEDAAGEGTTVAIWGPWERGAL